MAINHQGIPPTHCGWEFSMDWQKGQTGGGCRLLTNGSEFHMRSASWGTWFSGPLGCPCWLTPTQLSQAFPFLSELVIMSLPAYPICFLEAGDIPANHWEPHREKPAPGTLEHLHSANRFFLGACVCLRGNALHLTTCRRWHLMPAKEYQLRTARSCR